MCGIVGIVRRNGEAPVMQAEVRAMCDAIRHRGPDDEGIHAAGQAGLGMRRLSIIDLAGGHQPIFNEDGSKVIVFNGEIYNYRELRSDLIRNGHTLRTNSDTESIVHLYEEMGPDCVKRLRGMFGFAIWDEGARRLVLARDRFGIKPMYVTITDRQIAFSSELKALHAIGATGGELDWEALEAYFRLGYVPAPHTPFKAVRKLEPGHVLVWNADGTWTDRKYWDVPLDEKPAPPNVAEHVRDWLDESVAAHLVSDVPLAVLLSGGLDSSAVFSSMALAGASPHAYTVRYHGSGAEAADETALAAALVKKYDARLTIVDVQPNVAALLEPIVYALDEPHADESAIPSWLISERVAQDYKVVLAGTGGDELFAGYRRHMGLMLSDSYTRLPGAVRSAAAGVASLIPEPKSGGLGVNRIKRFLRTERGSLPARYLDMLDKLTGTTPASLFAPGIRGELHGSLAARRLDALYQAAGAPRGMKAPLYLDYKTYLPDDILHVSDRISMAHSLEVRVPFVDHVLVEHAFPLPDHTKISFGKPKPLLREALRPRLTPGHFTAPKRGFVGPTAAWLRHELKDMLTDELSPARMERLGFFDATSVQSLLQDHLTGRQNREAALWALLSFSLWHRVFIESGPRVAAAPTAVAL